MTFKTMNCPICFHAIDHVNASELAIWCPECNTDLPKEFDVLPKALRAPDKKPQPKRMVTVSSPSLPLDAEKRMAIEVEDDRAENLAMVLEGIFGKEVFDDSAKRTAERVLRYWREYIPQAMPDFEATTFESDTDSMVLVRDIEFSSVCAHHLLPFYGKAHVAYLPNHRIIGLSKIPRLVDYWSRRPQTQERLSDQIAHDLKDRLDCHGVAVVVQARHTCMACRGVRKHNGAMVTSRMLGVFLTAPAAREEFLQLIRMDGV